MKLIPLPFLLLALLVGFTTNAGAADTFYCKDYTTQPQAQTAWEAAGKPNANRVDSDGDGIACESLPAGPKNTGDCKTQDKPVVVNMSRFKYPQSTLHLEIAIKDYHQPKTLHIDRTHTDQHRDAWHQVINKGWDADKDGTTDDMDEYTFAMSEEGGRDANIALIKPSDNRGSGSMLGSALRAYCDGQAFTVKPTGHRLRKTRILVVADHGKRLNRWVTSR